MLAAGFYNMDCMEGMKEFPDGFFDLAIVDPPYGGGGEGADGEEYGNIAPRDWNCRKHGRFKTLFDKYYFAGKNNLEAEVIKAERRGGNWAKKYGDKNDPVCTTHWDFAPGRDYFDELARVSKNQIIWGGNYFDLPPTRCFLVWHKVNIPEKFSMSMCEFAWTSFNSNAKLFACPSNGSSTYKRIHPTQKPVELYAWQLRMFARKGFRILDTHAGSASSLIACHRAGLESWGFEVEPVYFKMAKERLERENQQISVFDFDGGEQLGF